MYFLVCPVLFVVKTTGISPPCPGSIGTLGHPFSTVQPHPAFTEFIRSGVLPVFLNLNVCSTLDPNATVSNSKIKSENSIIGGLIGSIKSRFC